MTRGRVGVALLALAGGAVVVGPLTSCEGPENHARCLPAAVQVNKEAVHAGRRLVVRAGPFTCGASYPSGKTYTLTLYQRGDDPPVPLGSAAVRPDGSFRTTIRIPRATTPGAVSIAVGGSAFDQCDDTGSCVGYGVTVRVLAS